MLQGSLKKTLLASLPLIFGLSLALPAVAQRPEFGSPQAGNNNNGSGENSAPPQAPANAPVKKSLSGIWRYEENGIGMANVKLEQDGNNLLMILSYEKGPLPLKGKIKDDKIRVPFRGTSNVYEGTISSDSDRIEGEFTVKGEKIPFSLQRINQS